MLRLKFELLIIFEFGPESLEKWLQQASLGGQGMQSRLDLLGFGFEQ